MCYTLDKEATMGKDRTVKIMNDHGPMGFVLFMAYVGAAVYFVHQSSGLVGFVWALIKAVVWPAIIVFHVFDILNI
jgi:hypothetical protein